MVRGIARQAGCDHHGVDIGSEARDRLDAAGLLGAPVMSLHVVNDGDDEIVEVTVAKDASDADMVRVRGALGSLTCRVVRRPIGYGVSYRRQS